MNPAFEATATLVPALGRPRFGHAAQELKDRSTGLYNRAGFMAAANRAIAKADPSSTFAMIVLEFTDLREVCEIYGHAVAAKVIDRMVQRMRKLAGWRGVVGRTGRLQFTVVLPRASAEDGLRKLQRILGKPSRVEFDAGHSEIVLVPEVLIDSATSGTPVQDVYRDACRELARRQNDEQRRLHWLASERQRHSRPMGYNSR